MRPANAARLVALGLLLTAASLSAAPLPESHPKARQAARVYADLVAAVGDARPAPRLQLLARGAGRVQVAWYSPDAGAVFLEERTYDLCVQQGPDSLAALAVLLGHELAHFYGSHDWPGDFGNGFADLEIGRQLRDAYRERGAEYETEADVFGGFYGYVAGYNTLGVTPRLLSEIYRTFELDDDLPGYPTLAERQELARRSQAELARRVPIFDAARYLLILGEHELAATAFDGLAARFPSREILNDAGVAYAMEALTWMPPVPYALPFEVDPHTRLRQAALGQRGAQGDRERAERLLGQARQRFEAARARDTGYLPARLNLAALAWLAGRTAATEALLAEVESLAGDDALARADAALLRGLCRSAGDSAAAAAAFRAALPARPELAKRNLAALAGVPPTGLPPERGGPREAPVGPGSETHEAILAQPRDLSLARTGVETTLLYRDFGDREGFFLQAMDRTLVFVHTRAGYGGRTARGLAIGDPAARVDELYGTAPRQVPTVDGGYRVFPGAQLAVQVDRRGRVAGWLRFHVDEGFVDADVAAIASVPDLGPRVALVIGNEGYAGAAALRGAAADARAMAATLEAAGFEVIQATDADRSRMVGAIRRLGERLVERGGVGLFYYAGHGVQVDGANYLIPVGADIQHADEVVAEAVAVDLVLKKMESAGSEVSILLLDACRNNPYLGKRSGGSGLVTMGVEGAFVLNATAADKTAADVGDGEHSLFTGALLRHLLTSGQTLPELGYAVKKEVMAASDGGQVPEWKNQLTGNFYVIPRGVTVSRDLGFARPTPPPGTAADMVDVDGFRLDRTEVTNQAFAAFLNARGNRQEDGVAWLDADDDDAGIERVDRTWRARPGFEQHPVVEVSWYGARRYCEWRGARLPTARQWQRAARGAGEAPYPWGAALPVDGGVARANFHGEEDGFPSTAPVGSYPAGAGASGALDLAGNVAEWVDDARGDERLILGGSWYAGPEGYGRATWIDAALPNELTGFRCAAPGAVDGLSAR